MVKSIFKNIIMLALLIIVILLIFGIFFYGVLPSNKIVPEKVQYALPDTLQQELNTTLEDNQQNVLVTYVVKDSDINKYQATNDYQPGKIDPFADNSGGASTTSTTNTTAGSTTSNVTVDSNAQK
ncbi:MAG: hypothetical protein FWF46_06185 [Oscillospiraceae bacterium]|nr:hypothetical protein [Oscillospiraceae bacterium]